MADNEETSGKKTINVVDRRRFDSSGEERTESQHTESQHAESQGTKESKGTKDQAAQTQPGFTMESAPDKEEVAFGSFIMSLATQVLMQMGEMPAPKGMEIPVDLEAARQTIDIIAMLQRRTRGNVSAEEARFLEELLHSLRSSYVVATKKKG